MSQGLWGLSVDYKSFFTMYWLYTAHKDEFTGGETKQNEHIPIN